MYMMQFTYNQSLFKKREKSIITLKIHITCDYESVVF